MSDQFSQYIKLIGKGKKAGKYLSQQQAFESMTQVLRGQPSPEQIGAFLMLLRVREESVEELAGFVQACREHNNLATNNIPAIDLDMGCYAGKRRHQPWLVLAVKLLAQQGYKIFLHGTAEPESQRLYLDKVWQQLGWSTVKTQQQATDQLEQNGFCYMDLQYINPALYQLIQLRTLFGLRSCANTLARMLNPSKAKVSLHGVFHKHFDQRHVEVASLLNDQQVACFRGDGGEIEVNPEREFVLHQNVNRECTQVTFPALLPNWQVKPRELESEQLIALWTGETEDSYGLAAVEGTLAVMLCQIEKLTVNQALTRAKQLWLQRNTEWLSF